MTASTEMVVGDQTLTDANVQQQPGQQVTLFGTDDPSQVIERASAIATALADVIKKQGLATQIQGKSHVRVEGWTVLGSMIGVFPVLESCEAISIDGVDGFVATVNAQTMSGAVIGKASAYCMRSENRWNTADTYAVASMAQTRATSKALRIPLGFIMQIAGYETTPAEERDAAPPPKPKATNKQVKKLQAVLADNSDSPLWDVPNVLENASRRFGRTIEAIPDLHEDEAEQIIAGAEKWRLENPIHEVIEDGVLVDDTDDGIEFAPELPNVAEQEEE